MNIPPHIFEAIALAKCERAPVQHERPCSICGVLTYCRAVFVVCAGCRPEHTRRQGRAGNATHRAVQRGDIPPATSLTCVDCGAPGWCYDHRDYDKPLDVVPVCRRCNSKRGVAVPKAA